MECCETKTNENNWFSSLKCVCVRDFNDISFFFIVKHTILELIKTKWPIELGAIVLRPLTWRMPNKRIKCKNSLRCVLLLINVLWINVKRAPLFRQCVNTDLIISMMSTWLIPAFTFNKINWVDSNNSIHHTKYMLWAHGYTYSVERTNERERTHTYTHTDLFPLVMFTFYSSLIQCWTLFYVSVYVRLIWVLTVRK